MTTTTHESTRSETWLLADVGGTTTRLASLALDAKIADVEILYNAKTDGIEASIQAYLREQRRQGHRFQGAAIAVAGPIHRREISLTNADWRFDKTELADRLGLDRIDVINDFSANALALPTITPDEWIGIGGGDADPRATKLILGPGTGLGVSALIPVDDDDWVSVHSEGGHITMSSADADESRLIDIAREYSGHVSAEGFLSGTGLPALYRAAATVAGRKLDAGEIPSPEAIATAAAAGEPLANKTMSHFFAMLGSFAGDLALVFVAAGGVYVSGGIVPRCRELFLQSDFRRRFEEKGRLSTLNQEIATRLVTVEIPAFRGLAAMVEQRRRGG